jgi:hypothetical protein
MAESPLIQEPFLAGLLAVAILNGERNFLPTFFLDEGGMDMLADLTMLSPSLDGIA